MPQILIIFDIDGTLVHSNKIDSQCFAESYQAVFQRPFPTIDWRTYDHVTDDTIFRTVFQNHFGQLPTPEQQSEFQQVFVERIHQERVRQPEAFNEVPGAQRMVEQLVADDRFVVGIGTGGWRAPALVKLDFVNIATEKLYMGFADGHPTRSHIINHAIAQARAGHDQLEKIIYVGDAIWDVTTCREMDIPLIGMRVKGDVEVLEQEGISPVYSDYRVPEAFIDSVVEKAAALVN